MVIQNKLLECNTIKDFMNNYEFPKELKIKLVFTDNLDEEYQNHLKKYNKEYDYVSVFDYDGITCIPNTVDEETTLLINYDKNQELNDNNLELIYTVFHELIHAKDYYTYFKNNFNGKYDSSHHRDRTYGFTSWSEFNAERISNYEYCKKIHGSKINSNENLNNIINIDLPNYNEEIDKILKDDDLDMEEIIYNLMIYLGRYSAWEKLFPKDFINNQKFSIELSKYKPVVDELYNLLKNYSCKTNEYEEIKKYINHIKAIWVNIKSHKS